MPRWMLILGATLPAALGCGRSPSSQPTPSASASASALALAPRALTQEQVVSLVEALPEVKALASEVIGAGEQPRKKRPVVRVLSSPRYRSEAADEAGDVWEIVVADRERFDDAGQLTTSEPPDLRLRVNAFTGTLAVRDLNRDEYRDYSEWAAAQRAWARAAALVMSTPEWRAKAESVRSSAEARAVGAELGLAFVTEPRAGCTSRAADCRFALSGMRVCSSCAGGHWADFAVDPRRQTVHVSGVDAPGGLAYGEWRHEIRARARAEHDIDFLSRLERRAPFPRLRAGVGLFGYGPPQQIGAALPPQVRAVLERAGYAPLRAERYAGGFPLYVTRARGGARASDWHAFGVELVRASRARACEIVVEGRNERFQFDDSVLEDAAAGVYAFVDGAFHPWLAPER